MVFVYLKIEKYNKKVCPSLSEAGPILEQSWTHFVGLEIFIVILET